MDKKHANRRQFLSKFAAGATMASLGTFPAIMQAATPIDTSLVADSEDWLKKGLKGEHRIAYDGPEPHDAFPIIWTWAYYMTNNLTGVQDSNMTGLCVLRHNAIPFAMKDEVWAKYKFGEIFGINDNTTQKPALRNPYYSPKEGDFPLPVIDGIQKMQERGAMFCVCDLALTFYSGVMAQSMNMKPEDVKAEWDAAILPGIQAVPSGVWALGRAQEMGCGYIYAGG